jgi:hypothetical protein
LGVCEQGREYPGTRISTPLSTFRWMLLHLLLLYKGKRGPRGFATERREGPKMYGMMDLQESKRRHAEMLREAELNRLKKALGANRKGSATPRWASILSWELMRAAGLLRKFFRTPKNAA